MCPQAKAFRYGRLTLWPGTAARYGGPTRRRNRDRPPCLRRPIATAAAQLAVCNADFSMKPS